MTRFFLIALLAGAAFGQKVHTGIVPHPNADILKDPDKFPKRKPVVLSKDGAAPAAEPSPEDRAKRHEAAIRDFREERACPVTNRNDGPCAGYAVSFIKALVCGGTDRADNMQWVTTELAKEKGKGRVLQMRLFRIEAGFA